MPFQGTINTIEGVKTNLLKELDASQNLTTNTGMIELFAERSISLQIESILKKIR